MQPIVVKSVVPSGLTKAEAYSDANEKQSVSLEFGLPLVS